MAKVKIMAFELAAPLGRKEEVTDYLQRKGAVDISLPEENDRFSSADVSGRIAEANESESVLLAAQAVLKKVSPEKKPLTAMLEPRKEMTAAEYSEMSRRIPSILDECRALIEKDKEAEDLKAENVRLQTLTDSLLPWKNCDIPVCSGYTQKTAYILGTFREEKTRAEVLELLARELPERGGVEAEIVSSSDVATALAVFCLKEDAEEVETVLRAEGFIRSPDCPGRTAAEQIAEYDEQRGLNAKRYVTLCEEMNSFAGLRQKIEFAQDHFAILKDKLTALEKTADSGRVFFLKGYIAKRDAEKVAKYCEEHFDAAVDVTDPGEGDDVPVLLTNNAFAAPLENITGMYSLPGNADIDPTGVMAFFYYFFFGMMLSDAGYGLIMTLATGGILLWKKNLEPKMKNTLKMYCFCGISTVFWGALYGSWFGDAAAVICREFLGKDINPLPPIWTDAVTDLMNVLIICFILGLVHLFVGVLLKGIADWKNGRKFDAFCDTVPTYLTVLGIAPVFFNLFLQDKMPENYTALGTFLFNAVKTCHGALEKVSVPLLVVGIVLVILTGGRTAKTVAGKLGGGLYEVYNLFGGYLGDVLSYARLLALGLATGVIAQVMNMLGTLPESKPVKLVMFVIVFIVGHVANLAINVIGAYVHTNRLQYVEFFGKFYEGGGRAFVPLAANTQYYRFKEEN